MREAVFRLNNSSNAPRTNCWRITAAITLNNGRPACVGLNSCTSRYSSAASGASGCVTHAITSASPAKPCRSRPWAT